MRFDSLDLSGVRRIDLIAQGMRGGAADIRLDSPEGPVIGQLSIPPGVGQSGPWITHSCSIQPTRGLRNIYLTFSRNGKPEGKIVNLDQIYFLLDGQKSLLGLK